MACRWHIDHNVVEIDFHMAVWPQDLLDQQLHVRLVRLSTDPLARHQRRLVLTDIEIHPRAPDHNFLLIRQPRSFLQSLFVWTYCQYAELPCLLSVNGVGLNLDYALPHPCGKRRLRPRSSATAK